MQIRSACCRGSIWMPVLVAGTLGLGFQSCKKSNPVSGEDEPPEIEIVRVARRGPGYDQTVTASAIDLVYRNSGQVEVATIKTRVTVFNDDIVIGEGTQTLLYPLGVGDTVGHRIRLGFSEQPGSLLGSCYEYTTEATSPRGAVAIYRSDRSCR